MYTYTGGECYMIAFYAGHFEVRRETRNGYKVEWFGTYEECLKYLEDLRIANVDYDLNL